jgi:hypothetical protein
MMRSKHQRPLLAAGDVDGGKMKSVLASDKLIEPF